MCMMLVNVVPGWQPWETAEVRVLQDLQGTGVLQDLQWSGSSTTPVKVAAVSIDLTSAPNVQRRPAAAGTMRYPLSWT